MIIIAHRGASAVAPENTLASFKEAVRIGADMIELDVRLSSDGAIMVFHDQDLSRTTDGNGPVEKRTLAELRELDAGSWFSDKFRGEGIPTLEEVIQTIFPGRIELCIEIKIDQGRGKTPGQTGCRHHRDYRENPFPGEDNPGFL